MQVIQMFTQHITVHFYKHSFYTFELLGLYGILQGISPFNYIQYKAYSSYITTLCKNIKLKKKHHFCKHYIGQYFRQYFQYINEYIITLVANQSICCNKNKSLIYLLLTITQNISLKNLSRIRLGKAAFTKSDLSPSQETIENPAKQKITQGEIG